MKHTLSDGLLTVSAYVFIGIMAALCLYPMLVVAAVSVSNNNLVILYGYKLIPEEFSLDTFRYIFNGAQSWLSNAYMITIFITVVGTAGSLLVTSMMAYAISIKSVKYRNIVSFLIYFTMLFSAGLVPTYITMVNLYHLKNNLLAVILPGMFNVVYCFYMRTYFQSIPDSIRESATIDGANDFQCYWRIIRPLSTTTFVTVGMFFGLNYWNEWYQVLLYITDVKLFTLQYKLWSLLTNVNALTQLQNNSSAMGAITLPSETIKAGITVITIAPVLMIYPFVQSFFVKGIMVGAVKG